jgi:hypothetical protein
MKMTTKFIEIHEYTSGETMYVNTELITDVSDSKHHVKGKWGKPCRDVSCALIHTVQGGYFYIRAKETAKEIVNKIEGLQ